MCRPLQYLLSFYDAVKTYALNEPKGALKQQNRCTTITLNPKPLNPKPSTRRTGARSNDPQGKSNHTKMSALDETVYPGTKYEKNGCTKKTGFRSLHDYQYHSNTTTVPGIKNYGIGIYSNHYITPDILGASA